MTRRSKPAATTGARGLGRPAASHHLLLLTTTAVVTAAGFVAGASGYFVAWLYVPLVVVAAGTFRRRVLVAGHVALATVCLAATVLFWRAGGGAPAGYLLLGAPALSVTAALVVRLRERLEARRETYERLAALDPLTGVGNYRALHERLAYEIARHERHGRELAVMLLDLNRFKAVNEIYGHLAGDRVLRAVGRSLAATVREQDTIARQGGDEFSILAPETSTVEVMALARRIARELETIPVGGDPVSASIGWAIYPQDGASAEQLLQHADMALRDGKARMLPDETRQYWSEHLRRLRDAPDSADAGGWRPAADAR
jgi:diguanylate cyclase (GGDEF)-like protein